MRRIFFLWLLLAVFAILVSCNRTGRSAGNEKMMAENKIVQQEDGIISLKIDKAACYHDMINPASNTAEWDVVVLKSGRFNVWLSSATKDTTILRYKNSVRLNIKDYRLETLPLCDRIYQNSDDVSVPYYRADSFMGSLYLKDTGLYDIQLISEKIVPRDYKAAESSDEDQTKLLSVLLVPAKR